MNDKLFASSREASIYIASLSDAQNSHILESVADAVEKAADDILAANARDCAAMNPDDARYDRLLLTPARLADIVAGMRAVAALPTPLGKVLDSTVRPNGMEIKRISVPFGVIGAIFEARPNVVFDIFALCWRAGNACVLKGGHEAAGTNAVAVGVIRRALAEAGAPADACVLLGNDHEDTRRMLRARGEIDLVIPRGSRRLIDFVRDNALVPVIETGAGVCHTYVHTDADINKAAAIVFNAKTRRVGVCNALDCLIIDRSRLADLPQICSRLADKNVEIHADAPAMEALKGYPRLVPLAADEQGREWLDYKMSVVTVDNIDAALDYIARYGSHHSESIVSESPETTARFQRDVDAACVYANVSTAFTDGGEFGFGAEIGISTQKLHARGPMALREITTYKYLITGSGQTR